MAGWLLLSACGEHDSCARRRMQEEGPIWQLPPQAYAWQAPRPVAKQLATLFVERLQEAAQSD